MSIASEIQRISGCREDIKTAIAAKGVTVPETATLSSCPALIDSIVTGGGAAISSIVNTSYSAESTGTNSCPFTAEQKAIIETTAGTMVLPWSSNFYGRDQGGFLITYGQWNTLKNFGEASAKIYATGDVGEWGWNQRLYLNTGYSEYIDADNDINVSHTGSNWEFTYTTATLRRLFNNYTPPGNLSDNDVIGALHPPAFHPNEMANDPVINFTSSMPLGNLNVSSISTQVNQMTYWGGDFSLTITEDMSGIFSNLDKPIVINFTGEMFEGENRDVRFSYSPSSGDEMKCGRWTGFVDWDNYPNSYVSMIISGFEIGAPTAYPVYLNLPYSTNDGRTTADITYTWLSDIVKSFPYPQYSSATTGILTCSGHGQYWVDPVDYECFKASANRNININYNDGPTSAISDTDSYYSRYLDKNEITASLKDITINFDSGNITDNNYNYSWGNQTTAYSSNLNVF